MLPHGLSPVMTDTRIQLCAVVYIIIGVILHVGISHSQIKIRSPVSGKREFVTVAYSGSQQRTIRILITVIVPLYVKPCHVGVQSDKVSPSCFISYPPAGFGLQCYRTHAVLIPKSHKLQVNGNSTVIFLCTCISTARFSKAQASYITFVFNAR